MRKPIYIFLISLASMMTGCGLYTKYERQPIGFDAKTMFRKDTVLKPLNSLAWQQLFLDPKLQDLIDSALIRNTDLKMAKMKVDEAEATLHASRLAFLPSANIGADGSVNTNTSDRFQIGPSVSWEVDIFGKQRNLKEGAEAAYYASEAYRQASKTALIASVAQGYYTLMMLDEQLGISERTLKTWDENIRVLQALKRAGRSNEAAVLQARANRLKVEASTLNLKNQILAQENSMRSLLFNPDIRIERGEYSNQTFPDTLSAGLPLDLLSNRPDVREAELEVCRTFYNVNVARAAFYPTLTLSGNAGWTTSSGSVGNPSTWLASAMASLTQPLFNRGTLTANLEIARKENEIAMLKFQQKLLDAGMEVNDALSNWQTARERLKVDKKQIVALKGAVHNTRLLMRNTNTNYLEVLTAQQRLLEAELSEAADRYDAIQAIISLYHALGGGVE